MPYTYCKKNASGLTLVELMISMALSLLLMGGAVGIFISSKQAYRTQDAMSRNQEAGRFAIAALSRQIRSAGYTGCSSLEVITPKNLVSGSSPSFQNSVSIIGYDGGATNATRDGSVSWTPPTSVNWVPNTDVIVVSSAGGCGADLSSNMATTDAGITVANADSCGFKTDDILLITDCSAADLFRATAVTTADGNDTISHNGPAAPEATSNTEGSTNANTLTNTTGSLSRAYERGATVLRFLQTTYFIGKPVYTGNTTYQPNPALYRIGVNGTEEVVDNVENMQIKYGVDTGNDGIADVYQDANAVTDWSRVLSARLSLLVRSDDGVISETQDVTFNDLTVNDGDNADRRLRSIFNTTISIRNRLP